MKRSHPFSIAIGVSLCVWSAAAQEKKITRKDLPPAVEKTVAEQAQGATIKEFSTEVEHGQRIYEVALTVNGHGKDVSIDANGHVLEVEEEIAFTALPAVVQAGLETAAAGGTLGKVESLTKHDRLVAYEAVVTTGTRHREVQVGPDGRKLAHPE